MFNKNLMNQVAIVTGGNSGIGKATSIQLAEMGAKVMILGLNEARNEEVCNFIIKNGGYAEGYHVDVTSSEEVNNTISTIIDKHKQIDILVCNAGNTTPPMFATDTSYDDWNNILNVHMHGTFYCIKACGEIMKKNKYGRIVLMSSLAGIFGLTGNIAYAAAKTAIVGMTYTLAKELGAYNITVNAVQPGVIRTDITKACLEAKEEDFVSDTPIPRIGKPEDVANAIAFFCLPQSDFITGAVMPIDGGYILQCGMNKLMYGICEQLSDK